MKCRVHYCKREVHARGLCSTHYNQYWRNGHVESAGPLKEKRCRKHPDDYDDHRGRKPDANSKRNAKELDNHREALSRARYLYNLVVGYAGRLHWRREIQLIESEINRLSGAQ